MQRESDTVAAREAAAGNELAERLDTLSRPLAERIFGRAIGRARLLVEGIHVGRLPGVRWSRVRVPSGSHDEMP